MKIKSKRSIERIDNFCKSFEAIIALLNMISYIACVTLLFVFPKLFKQSSIVLFEVCIVIFSLLVIKATHIFDNHVNKVYLQNKM